MVYRIASFLFWLWAFAWKNGGLPSAVADGRLFQRSFQYYDDRLIYDANNNNETNSTDAPADANSTVAPTTSPNSTIAPTPYTDNNSTNHTLAPTMAPTGSSNHTTNHTEAPATAPPQTPAPQPPPTSPPVNPPVPPPTDEPAPTGNKKEHISFLRIIGKTIAWMILLLLGTVAFGAIMQHRYRIYYFARGCYFTVLRLSCTQWILRKLRFERGSDVDTSLNTIIFDNEMTEGLLMQENND